MRFKSGVEVVGITLPYLKQYKAITSLGNHKGLVKTSP